MRKELNTPVSITPEELSELFVLVGGGDEVAFERVYHATSAKLFGIIFRIIRHRQLAEEVFQEVFVRIWERASEFDPSKASPITWMATIARNRAIDELRKRHPVTAADSIEGFEFEDQAPSPFVEVHMREEWKRLEACLGELEGRHCEAVKLAYLDGYSRQELADRFDQPVNTIKTWLHRSLKRLRECLG